MICGWLEVVDMCIEKGCIEEWMIYLAIILTSRLVDCDA